MLNAGKLAALNSVRDGESVEGKPSVVASSHITLPALRLQKKILAPEH